MINFIEDFQGAASTFLVNFKQPLFLTKIWKHRQKKQKNNNTNLPELESPAENVLSRSSSNSRFITVQAEEVLKAVKCNNHSGQFCFYLFVQGLKRFLRLTFHPF